MTIVKRLADTLVFLEKEKGSDIAVKEFLQFVKKRKIQSLLPALVRELERREAHEKNENIIYVETPYEVSSSTLEAIAKSIGASGDIKHDIDESLVGGFRVRQQFSLYDASFKKSLENLKSILNSHKYVS